MPGTVAVRLTQRLTIVKEAVESCARDQGPILKSRVLQHLRVTEAVSSAWIVASAVLSTVFAGRRTVRGQGSGFQIFLVMTV